MPIQAFRPERFCGYGMLMSKIIKLVMQLMQPSTSCCGKRRQKHTIFRGRLRQLHNQYYKKERAAFQRRHFKFTYCPASVLLGCACMKCPLKGECVKCNPGSLLGVDHQTITEDSDGNSRFTFRPYKASLYEQRRKNLQRFCDYFKLSPTFHVRP